MLTLDLRMLLQQDCAKTSQRPATRILWILTEHYKDRLPPEIYKELRERYELTAFEQREIKAQKEEQRGKAKQKGSLKLRNQLQQIQQDLALCEIRLKDVNTSNPRFWEGRKKHLEEQKSIVEAQLSTDKPLEHTSKRGRRYNERKRK